MLTVKSLPAALSPRRLFGQIAVPEWATHIALITGAESLDNMETFERMVSAVASQRQEDVFDAWQLGIKDSRERVVVCWFRKSDADPTVLSQSTLFALTRSLA
jgi:hypothetical protein